MKSSIFKMIPLFLTAVLLILARPHPLQAQLHPIERQAQIEMENLKKKIANVEELLRAFDHKLARELLAKARQLFTLIQSDLQRKAYDSARARLKAAHSFLDRAIKLATDMTLRRYISELTQLMRRAEHEVLGRGHKNAERMLKRAKAHQDRAERALQNGLIARAYEQYAVAISLARNSLTLVAKNSPVTTDVNFFEQERNRFTTLAGRVKETAEASHNQQALKIYEQALRSFARAEQELRTDNRALAEQMYNGAMRLLLRALDLASKTDNPDAANVKRELATVVELFNSVKRRRLNNMAESTATLVRRIERNIRRAENLLAARRVVLARAQLRLARRLLERLFRAQSPSGMSARERAVRELEFLKEDIAATAVRLGRGDPLAQDFLAIAQQTARRAERDIQQAKYRSAAQHILMGQRFLAKAENPARDRKKKMTDAAVRARISRLQQLLRDAETVIGTGGTDFILQLISDARSLQTRAERLRRRNRPVVALELADMGIELVKTALRLAQE